MAARSAYLAVRHPLRHLPSAEAGDFG